MDDQNRDHSQSQERVVNFALLIQQIETSRGMEYKLQAQNQGIPDPEVILLVESCLHFVLEWSMGEELQFLLRM